jgi:ABC-type branched-subunit amino acid transport system permease subunit
VVIVISGISSIRGAFVAALLIGLADTLGRSFSVDILRLSWASPARTVGPALASMLIYLMMALVLYFRPTGLFRGAVNNRLPLAIFLGFALLPLAQLARKPICSIHAGDDPPSPRS